MSKQTLPPLWTRDFVFLALSNLLIASGSFLLLPTLPIYAEQVLGAGNTEKGAIVGFYTLSALLIRPFAGIALDSWGRKTVFLGGLLFFVLCMPLYFAASSLLFLLLIRIVHGLSWGVVTTGGSTIVSDIVPPARRGEGIGYFGMSFTVSMALGPVIGLWIITGGNYEPLFGIASLMVASNFLFALWVRYPKVEKRLPGLKIGWQDLFDAKGLPTALLALIASAIYGGLITFMSSFTTEIALPPIQLPFAGTPPLEGSALFFVTYALGLTVIRPVAGKWMDKKGPKQVLVFGFLMLMVGMACLASAKTLPWFMLTSLLTGIGMGVILPTTLTMAVNLVSPERRGVANSTFFSAVDIGVGVGAVLLGTVADLSSIQTMYYLCAVLVLLPLAWFVFYVEKDYVKQMAELQS